MTSFCEFPDDGRYRFLKTFNEANVQRAEDGTILAYTPAEDDPDKLASMAATLAYYSRPQKPDAIQLILVSLILFGLMLKVVSLVLYLVF